MHQSNSVSTANIDQICEKAPNVVRAYKMHDAINTLRASDDINLALIKYDDLDLSFPRFFLIAVMGHKT